MILFKVLNGRKSCNGGDSKWVLKRWMPKVEVDPCKSGYHLCRPQDLIYWLGPDIYIAEGRGKMVECDDKVVYTEARIVRHLDTWDDRSARLFACWCVRNTPVGGGRTVWDLISDERNRNLVVVAERYARGEATKKELSEAWEAAREAAWEAAREAAREAAWEAAREAAWEAAWTATREAAWEAAWEAARAAQTTELMRVLGLTEEVKP